MSEGYWQGLILGVLYITIYPKSIGNIETERYMYRDLISPFGAFFFCPFLFPLYLVPLLKIGGAYLFLPP